jgi:hypothetical protein
MRVAGFGRQSGVIVAEVRSSMSSRAHNHRDYQRPYGSQTCDLAPAERWAPSGRSASMLWRRSSAAQGGRQYGGLVFRRSQDVAAWRRLDEHHITSVAWRQWPLLACWILILGVEVSLEPVRPLLAYAGSSRKESRRGFRCIHGLGSQQAEQPTRRCSEPEPADSRRHKSNKNKCQSSLLTLPGRADKGLPCRASYALSTLGP